MMKRIFALSMSVAIAAATTARTAPTQQQPATIPVPLAAALMGGAVDPTRPPTRFFVGQAPDGFPAELIPPGPVSVIGGTMASGARTVILAYPAAVENGVTAYRQFLRAQGWIAPSMTEGRTGFVSDP